MSSYRNHSPGPWSVVSTPAGKAKVVDRGGFSVANATNTVYAQGHIDACLIAAAPDLLEALQGIHDWLVCAAIATAEDMAQSFPEMEVLARSALAKATGEAK